MSDLSLQDFLVREADCKTESNVLSNIRKLVFIVEQSVPQEEEWDGKDDDAWHWIATDQEDVPIGTARLLPDGQIGRMAVLAKYRGAGVGAALLQQAVIKARHLGFETVYLNAQTHALGFYERSGFIQEGEEFDEAGIPHIRMTQTLQTDGNHEQRRQSVAAANDIAIKPFDMREVSLSEYRKQIRQIRKIVLVSELGQSEAENLLDEADNNIHWVAEDDSGQTIGCIQMSLDGTVSHLAVLAHYRRRGAGTSLLELCTAKAVRFGLKRLNLTGPVALKALFEQSGYEQDSDADNRGEAQFSRTVVVDNLHEEPLRPAVGAHYLDGAESYQLGVDKKLILMRREEDFRQVILEMCAQARHSLRIFSPVLEHKLFDHDDLMQIVSALARRNRYTQIEILLYDSHRVVKNGHALLNISRKLPSSIAMKIVHPELRQLNHEYVIADTKGVVYRIDYEDFDGWANFNDVTEANRLNRQFTAAWESGLLDPNLRQLRI